MIDKRRIVAEWVAGILPRRLPFLGGDWKPYRGFPPWMGMERGNRGDQASGGLESVPAGIIRDAAPNSSQPRPRDGNPHSYSAGEIFHPGW